MILVVGLVVLATVALVLMRARRRQRQPDRSLRGTDLLQPKFAYRAVSIRTGSHPCAAVTQLSRNRFLLGKTPILPLPTCDRERCRCTYCHHPDRRAPSERRELQAFDTQRTERADGPDHRHNRGRRRLDYG